MEGNIKYKLTNSINGKGKEYNYDDNLIFEGEYLNGKRNGEGKEYYNNGKLKYEGEYFNDKRNGKGKEYYYNGKLKCDGEYLNGIELLGTEYDANGKIKNQFNKVKGIGKTYKLFRLYEGEYLNGKRNGKGKEYYNNGKLEFEGEYLDDKRWNGKGYDIPNNLIYELN